jgi:hypothetical protein
MRHYEIGLINPWSGSVGRVMTWPDILTWAAENLRPEERKSWLQRARRAIRRNDGKTLGIMIIGS